MNLHRMTRIALLTALSLILFVLEGFLPLPLPVPGAKLGLAAIVTLIALHLLPTRDAGLMLTLRILLSSTLGGGVAPMLYSLAGGAASFTAMVLLKQHSQLSIVGISAAGGFLHNMAQLLVAAAVMQTTALFSYAPVLGFIGILTGIGIGIAAQVTLQKIYHNFVG
ncbi:heptaprenyl diphosphate synthase component I [Selenomonas infelix ATCC 43532]|uniref:Heptaprenyl diphosphate synthase component I n=1 Tax=Selenomonas infelix ATCC 43532 TaxID=679201 RepID=G5GR63_9FIRM|nr:Gx transporter family protein [Selenomonas infelix]EHG19923.1 heptaprenyl diphosphate synthase component I [Selenomonas infelix ATCC 43532]